MKRAPLERVQARLEHYVEASAGQPLLITQDGQPVAMLVGLERGAKPKTVKLRDILERAWKDYEKRGGISHKQFWKEVRKEAKMR
jgi:prevent-host-death family protein